MRQQGVGQWVAQVLPGSDWDLKSNKSTIFGVAWAFDKLKPIKTSFTSVDFTFSNAADFGNFHAGYTGTYANVSKIAQYRLAGLGEVAKFHDVFERLFQLNYNIPPYGDQPIDFMWNTRGMNAADADIKINGRPAKTSASDRDQILPDYN